MHLGKPGDDYCYRHSNPNFELKILSVDMFPYEDSEIMSVCLSVPRENKSP